MQDLPSVPAGNEASIALLERCLTIARAGRTTHVSVVMVQDDGASAMYSGDRSKEVFAFYGATKLCRSLENNIDALARLRAGKAEFPANRVMFDLAAMSLCFDFAISLIKAEMTRLREDAPAPLTVVWNWGQDDPCTTMLSTPQRERNFTHILRPLVRLIGAVEDLSSSDGRPMEGSELKPVMEAFQRGEPVPKFQAPAEVRAAVREFIESSELPDPVTITLREAEHTPHRNSDIPEWLKFGKWLEDQGEKVIFVRDTAKAHEPLEGAVTCPAASENLLVRTALYQEAKANIFVSNGPCILAMFGDKPFLTFIELQDDPNYPANTVDAWQRDIGISPPEQLPWCRSDQRIIWARDRFETIRDAWIEQQSS